MAAHPEEKIDEKTEVKAPVDFDKSKTPIRGPEAFPLLEIVQGPKQGVWFTVAHQKEITLGRAVTNHILLEDNSVSRSHAVLEARGEGGETFVIKDIGSRNGTFVNEKKIQGEVLLKHLDTIKLGIYLFRYLTEPTEAPFVMPGESRDEAATVMEVPEETGATALPEASDLEAGENESSQEQGESEVAPTQEEDPSSEVPSEENSQESKEADLQQEMAEALGQSPEQAVPAKAAEADLPDQGTQGLSFRNLFVILGILLLLGGGGALAYYLGAFDSLKNGESSPTSSPAGSQKTPGQDTKETSAQKTDQDQTSDGSTELSDSKPSEGQEPVVDTKPLKPDVPVAGDQVPIFLEVESTPVPAKIFYQGKELGVSPFKVSVAAPPGKAQEITAEVILEAIDEKVDVKKTFTVGKQDELVNLSVKLPLGTFLIEALPKEGRLFLEGKFKGEQGPAKSLEIKEIEYNKPIYLPHGKYVAEIKVPENLAGSKSQVDQVRYRREFSLGPEQAEYKLKAPDAALQVFPAKITTRPPGASVLLDGKKLGETPFTGDLPTGRHTLVLKKEGFSDFEKEIAIELNTPYEADFNLETSPAGSFINQARGQLKQGKTQAAIEQLAEALKRQPDPMELSQIHLLLGDAFLKSKNFDQALAYFQKEAASTEYGAQAKLGMAQALSGQGKKDQALIQVVDVYLKTKDEKLKSQAETTFKTISPMKSVLYVTSEPSGAAVQVNGNAIGQTTPVILSDLMVGSYRVGVNKEGFQPFESRITLPVSTIKPVIVKLEPNP